MRASLVFDQRCQVRLRRIWLCLSLTIIKEFIAKKLCPELILVPVDYHRVGEMSGKVMKICKEYDPNMLIAGCDEGYLKYVHASCRIFQHVHLDPIVSRRILRNTILTRKNAFVKCERESTRKPNSLLVQELPHAW